MRASKRCLPVSFLDGKPYHRISASGGPQLVRYPRSLPLFSWTRPNFAGTAWCSLAPGGLILELGAYLAAYNYLREQTLKSCIRWFQLAELQL